MSPRVVRSTDGRHRISPRGFVALGLITAVLVAGCGSASKSAKPADVSPSSSSTTADASLSSNSSDDGSATTTAPAKAVCALVTKADIAAALPGATVGEGSPTTNATLTCGFEVTNVKLPSSDTLRSDTVEVDVFSTPAPNPLPDTVAEIPGAQYDAHLGVLRVPLADGGYVQYATSSTNALNDPSFIKQVLVKLALATRSRFGAPGTSLATPSS